MDTKVKVILWSVLWVAYCGISVILYQIFRVTSSYWFPVAWIIGFLVAFRAVRSSGFGVSSIIGGLLAGVLLGGALGGAGILVLIAPGGILCKLFFDR